MVKLNRKKKLSDFGYNFLVSEFCPRVAFLGVILCV